MSLALPSALVAVPSVPLEPGDLARHLGICRLQAELEVLEAQLARARAADGEVSAAGESGGPFAERAQDLVDRMVESLRSTAREEHREIVAHGRAEAEARLALARMRAEDLVADAREELLQAIAERDAAFGADLVVDLEDVMVDRSDLEPRPAAPTASGLPVSTAASPPEGMLLPDPAPAPAPVLDTDPEVAVEPGSPEVAVELAQPEVVQRTASPSDPPSAVAPVSHEVGIGAVPDSSAPAPTGAVAVEEARTDAAFDVWLAVAPVPVEPADADTDERARRGGRAGRSPLVLAVEIGGVLLLVAVLVVLGLVLVG